MMTKRKKIIAIIGIVFTLVMVLGGIGLEPISITHAGITLGESFMDDLNRHDTGIWHKADGWTNGGMFNCGWQGDHVGFDGGVMRLTLDRVPSSGRPFTSGEYRSNGFYQFGVFEVRMKAAKGQGIVSSFFTYTGPSDNQPWDEIDIEFLGRDTTQMQTNYFTNGQGGHERLIKLGFDAAEDFHVYKIVWAPKRIEWYVDDRLVHKETGSRLPQHPQKIMMNLWPGIHVDGWLGHFSYKAPLVAEYDWVRYTKMDANEAGQ
jgi:endo-1,3-1,4-beta-glycanase ExoK